MPQVLCSEARTTAPSGGVLGSAIRKSGTISPCTSPKASRRLGFVAGITSSSPDVPVKASRKMKA
jgi:hypothetical protein